jgi:hypothetical protein
MKDTIVQQLLRGELHLTQGVTKWTAQQVTDTADYLHVNGIVYLFFVQPDKSVVGMFSQHLPWVNEATFNQPHEAVAFLNRYWTGDNNVKGSERVKA